MILQQTPGLSFEAESHKYFLDGKHLPSVTQIMKSAGLIDFSFVPRDTLEAACARGTAVHKICELWDKGTLDLKSLDSVGMAYLKQYIAISETFLKGRKWTAIELPLACRNLFCGTLDRCIVDGRKITIADIKTGIDAPNVGVQLTAYLELVLDAIKMQGTIAIPELVSINLTEESGNIKRHKPAHAAWLAARTIYNYKNN